MLLFELGLQQLGPRITIQRFLQKLLERQDHALLAQAQGLVLVEVAGHDHRAENQQRQGQADAGASRGKGMQRHYVS
ncbi:hypothetical protein D9M73_287290 [compost metagenome]